MENVRVDLVKPSRGNGFITMRFPDLGDQISPLKGTQLYASKHKETLPQLIEIIDHFADNGSLNLTLVGNLTATTLAIELKQLPNFQKFREQRGR
jgi:hypothetical protein